MREDDFNLIREPWLRVRKKDGEVAEISLLELFRDAHTVQALAGELPTQNAAVLRVLLAVLHTVFSRMDIDGEEVPMEDLSKKESLARWGGLWTEGRFPMKPIQKYLESVEDRFWLFDREHPFFQVPAAKEIAGRNTQGELKCKAVKLNSSINQSENKGRIFLHCAGAEKEKLSYGEAARWLIHMVACDDCAVKKSAAFKENAKVQKQESPGVGWLGKLGIVYAEGENLFETLMLNMVLWPDGEYKEFRKETPLWELDQIPGSERQKLPWPDNMAALLTWPSRFVLLERENGYVTGCYPLCGVYFDRDAPAAFLEQMTRRNGNIRDDRSPYYPRLHERNSFLWRELDSLIASGIEGDDSRPGVVRWINRIQGRKTGLDRDKLVRFHSVGIYYDKNKSSIEQVEEDCLDLHVNLVSELGRDWRKLICQEVAFTQSVSGQLGYLAEGLWVAASGNKPPEGKAKDNAEKQVVHAKEAAQAGFYDAMDLPFRSWLRGISAEDSDMEEKRKEWRDFVRNKAKVMGEDMALQAGPSAYVGHSVEDRKTGTRIYSTAAVYGYFLRDLNHLH